LVALPVPRPYGDYGKVVNSRIEQSFPDAAAAFIAWLVNESGWTVEEVVVRFSFGRTTSQSCFAGSAISTLITLEPMFVGLKRDAFLTSWSADALFTTERKLSRSATLSRQSNGRMTS